MTLSLQPHLDVIPIRAHFVGLLLLTCAAVHCQQAAARSLDHASIIQRLLKICEHANLQRQAQLLTDTGQLFVLDPGCSFVHMLHAWMSPAWLSSCCKFGLHAADDRP